MAESSEEWELSKENIRPIQQGRKQKVLKVALAPHPEEVISQQRQSFENELRTYSGNDPLFVWCKYIKWVEQNYPKGGREGHIKQLMERCLSILKDEKKYFDDERFIDIMLKYANLSGKPLDVYNYMYSNKIGCKSATFFINWSWELEQLGSLKKADEVITEGMHRKTEPFEKMKSYHADFEIRLATKIKANIEKGSFEAENSRSAFAVLKPQKKNLAPVMRTGEAVITNNRSSLLFGRQQSQPKSVASSVKIPFKIYDAENINPSLPVQTPAGARNSLNPESYKENERKPSKWNKVKVKSYGQNLKTLSESNPDFKFHCDENEEEIRTPRSVPKTSNILSTRRRTPSPPMALFEPLDPLKKPMYPKNKVYGGAEEYSLEEIRAAAWREQESKKKAEVQEILLVEQQKMIQEKVENVEKLEKKVKFLEKTVERLQSHFVSSDAKPSDILSTSQAKNGDFNEMLLNDQKSQSIMQSKNNILSQHVHNNSNVSNYSLSEKSKDSTDYYNADKMVREFYNKTLSQTIDEGENKNLDLNLEFNKKCSTISSNNCLPDNLPQTDYVSNISKVSDDKLPFSFYHDPTTKIIPNFDSIVSSEGILNNTAAKHNISKNSDKLSFPIFNDPTGNLTDISCQEFANLKITKESEAQSISQQINSQQHFNFYIDPTEGTSCNQSKVTSSKDVLNQQECLSDLNEKDQVNVFSGEPNELPFTFYHDPTSMVSNSVASISSKEAISRDCPLILPDEQLFEEDSENMPPKGYIQKKNDRELAGILEPSKNILFIPLEQLDDSDSEFEDDIIYQNEKPCADETLIPPSNTEQFSTAKFLASTPCVTRSNKALNAEISKHQIQSPNETIPKHVSFTSQNTISDQKKSDDENVITKLETISFKEPCLNTELKTTSHSRLPNMLSVIMETSTENYSKSSSSSSSVSLTKSNHQDSASHSLHKQQSKLEPYEPGVSSICEKNLHSVSLMHKERHEKSEQKVELYLVEFDPFDQKLTEKLLKSVKVDNYKNFYTCNKSIRVVKMGENVCIGNDMYIIDSLIDEGAYAKVFKAMKLFETYGNYKNKALAFKVCKKANEWEFYICCEIQRRLSEKRFMPDIKNSVMSIMSAIKYTDGILLVNEYFNFGTLLDVINFHKKQNTTIPEILVIFFTLEILHIVSKLHKCNIIHGDIKPDNFLLTSDVLEGDILKKLSVSTTYLRLIDFGRAIDLNLYDEGICFTTTFSTSHFKCNEMKDKKPWVFQLDWYGVLGCIHTMLFQEYMSVIKKNDIWVIEKKFKRYWYTSLWEPLFNKLLNIPKCYEEPDVTFFISMIESMLEQNATAFIGQLTRFFSAYSKQK